MHQAATLNRAKAVELLIQFPECTPSGVCAALPNVYRYSNVRLAKIIDRLWKQSWNTFPLGLQFRTFTQPLDEETGTLQK